MTNDTERKGARALAERIQSLYNANSASVYDMTDEIEAILRKSTASPSDAKPVGKSAEEWVQDILECFPVPGISGYERGILIEVIQSIQQSAIAASQNTNGGGYPCDGCGNHYNYDLSVPDDLWKKISPRPLDGYKTGGLLCPECILSRALSATIPATLSPKPLKELIADGHRTFWVYHKDKWLCAYTSTKTTNSFYILGASKPTLRYSDCPAIPIAKPTGRV